MVFISSISKHLLILENTNKEYQVMIGGIIMNWYKVELWGIDKPSVIDDTSSKVIIYFRKDIKAVKIPVPTMDGEIELKDGYEWMQIEIPKEDWELYKTAFQNASDISDLTDAVIELAGILGGE